VYKNSDISTIQGCW